MKLGPTNMLQVGPASLSALSCVQGERTDAGRSADRAQNRAQFFAYQELAIVLGNC
jgi:hypothetical protein